MKIIKNFNKFSVNESQVETEMELSTEIKAENLTGEVTLYRLTSHPVVDLSSPGEYYVCDKSDVDPKLLDNSEGNELYLITVKCNSNNIDLQKSKTEANSLGNGSIVAVKDDKQCQVVSVQPYGNNPVD